VTFKRITKFCLVLLVAFALYVEQRKLSESRREGHNAGQSVGRSVPWVAKNEQSIPATLQWYAKHAPDALEQSALVEQDLIPSQDFKPRSSLHSSTVKMYKGFYGYYLPRKISNE
jgi:hypothetical protein